MRILVTGKNGQLGRSIQKIISTNNNDFVFVGRNELDLSSQDSINNYFNNNDKFDIIVNCAAYTAVDMAEKEQGLANQINCQAVKQLAEITNKQKSKLIHISTDYVFDGKSDKPYLETDATKPINVYGKTKLCGEKALQDTMPTNAIIIRTSWVYSEFGNNFVKTILRLGKERSELSIVSDQIGSPTYATDLAGIVLTIIENKKFKEINQRTQIYHYSNKGEVSWYGFTKEIFRLAKIDCEVNGITTEQYPTLAKRPKNTVINKDKISHDFDMDITYWKKSLKSCIATLKE